MNKISGNHFQTEMRQNILEKANSVLDGKQKSDVFSNKINQSLIRISSYISKSK